MPTFKLEEMDEEEQFGGDNDIYFRQWRIPSMKPVLDEKLDRDFRDAVAKKEDWMRKREERKAKHSEKYDRKLAEVLKAMTKASIDDEAQKENKNGPFLRKMTENEMKLAREKLEQEFASPSSTARMAPAKPFMARPKPRQNPLFGETMSSLKSIAIAPSTPSCSSASTPQFNAHETVFYPQTRHDSFDLDNYNCSRPSFAFAGRHEAATSTPVSKSTFFAQIQEETVNDDTVFENYVTAMESPLKTQEKAENPAKIDPKLAFFTPKTTNSEEKSWNSDRTLKQEISAENAPKSSIFGADIAENRAEKVEKLDFLTQNAPNPAPKSIFGSFQPKSNENSAEKVEKSDFLAQNAPKPAPNSIFGLNSTQKMEKLAENQGSSSEQFPAQNAPNLAQKSIFGAQIDENWTKNEGSSGILAQKSIFGSFQPKSNEKLAEKVEKPDFSAPKSVFDNFRPFSDQIVTENAPKSIFGGFQQKSEGKPAEKLDFLAQNAPNLAPKSIFGRNSAENVDFSAENAPNSAKNAENLAKKEGSSRILAQNAANPAPKPIFGGFQQKSEENPPEKVDFPAPKPVSRQNSAQNAPKSDELSTFPKSTARVFTLFKNYIGLLKELNEEKKAFESSAEPGFRSLLKRTITEKVTVFTQRMTSQESRSEILEFFKKMLRKEPVRGFSLMGDGPVIELKTEQEINYSIHCIVEKYMSMAELDDELAATISDLISRISMTIRRVEKTFIVLMLNKSTLLRQNPHECREKFMKPGDDEVKAIEWNREKALITLFFTVFTKNALITQKGRKMVLSDDLLWKFVDSTMPYVLEVPKSAMIVLQLITTCKPRLCIDSERYQRLLEGISEEIVPKLELEPFPGDEAVISQLKRMVQILLQN